MASEAMSLVDGSAEGAALRLDEPLSFWGGLDPTTGVIIDTHHPQQSENVIGSILVMPYGRGSSSSSQVLTEALRLGTGPAAIVLAAPDHIVALGALVAGLMYDISCPILVVDGLTYNRLTTGTQVRIESGRLLEP